MAQGLSRSHAPVRPSKRGLVHHWGFSEQDYLSQYTRTCPRTRTRTRTPAPRSHRKSFTMEAGVCIPIHPARAFDDLDLLDTRAIPVARRFVTVPNMTVVGGSLGFFPGLDVS